VPTVTIEGKAVTVAPDSTILEAARKAHVWIPTLCYHPTFSTQGTCRICMVEIEGADVPNPRSSRIWQPVWV
jgi:NADH dehydrogenase/NADH:ubiquinone oxidoreductase subunit G